ncbi:MAG: family 16 glycosylhydrolase [Proteobacteria bacterium]|nr:family 16 glycosylhydrolase [Cystobacterineae bacterium]MCL2314853.1 family 16 glycosylhydrolase [Pseudomonadota bacterium]
MRRILHGSAATAWTMLLLGVVVACRPTPSNASFKVIYHLNGGMNHAHNQTSYNNSSFPITLFEPTLAEHTFQGWYTNADFVGSQVTTLNSAQHMVFYAKWVNNRTGLVVQWRDSFLEPILNEEHWNYETGWGPFDIWNAGGNAEAQYYTKDAISIRNGLVLSAWKTSEYNGYFSYASGKITTQGKVAARPGTRVEARMRLPLGSRAWPAFWMLPVNNVYGGWAASGEVDIMEARGDRDNIVYSTLHFGGLWPDNIYRSAGAASNGHEVSYMLPKGGTIDEWHTYAIDWTLGGIAWYVDDIHIGTISNTLYYSVNSTRPSAPFDQEFYIIFNLAVGSDATPFVGGSGAADWERIEMNVEYVSLYKLEG